MANCKTCQKEIEWRRTAAGGWCAFNPRSPIPHARTCGKPAAVDARQKSRAKTGLESGLRRNLDADD